MPARPVPSTVRELRGAIRRRVRRVRGELWGILQTTVAAGAAWALASLLHPHPFFAPAAAVIALGVSRGGRTVRAVELTVCCTQPSGWLQSADGWFAAECGDDLVQLPAVCPGPCRS